MMDSRITIVVYSSVIAFGIFEDIFADYFLSSVARFT